MRRGYAEKQKIFRDLPALIPTAPFVLGSTAVQQRLTAAQRDSSKI